jgi:hypothetical protein
VTAVLLVSWIPFGLAPLFMLRFLRVSVALRAPVAATAD